MKSRIMYIERKGDEISGPARIGRVTFSKSGKSVYYKGRRFHTLSGSGFKANYFDWETEEHYWISGCKKRGGDRLYGRTNVENISNVTLENATSAGKYLHIQMHKPVGQT